MKLFVFICLSVAIVQVWTAPAAEDVVAASSDGKSNDITKPAEENKEVKSEEKVAEKADQLENPKKSEIPAEKAPQSVEKATESAEKATESAEKTPESAEKATESTEKTPAKSDETAKVDEKPSEAPEVTNKLTGTKDSDVISSTLLGLLYNALFGGGNQIEVPTKHIIRVTINEPAAEESNPTSLAELFNDIPSMPIRRHRAPANDFLSMINPVSALSSLFDYSSSSYEQPQFDYEQPSYDTSYSRFFKPHLFY